jgi:predicted TIM-barrel fold metal-dependent hydrolase
LRVRLERIRPYGWYAKLFIGADELPDYMEYFRPITDADPARPHGRTPPNHPARNVVIEMLKRENVWMLLGNGHRMSAQAERWDDMVPLGRELYETAPDRCIFGTDWPHTHSQKEGGGRRRMRSSTSSNRFLPDEKARRAVLVDNPAKAARIRIGGAICRVSVNSSWCGSAASWCHAASKRRPRAACV